MSPAALEHGDEGTLAHVVGQTEQSNADVNHLYIRVNQTHVFRVQLSKKKNNYPADDMSNT